MEDDIQKADLIYAVPSFKVSTSQINDEKNYTFVVYGDTRTNHENHYEIVNLISKVNPEIVFHTGDMVEFGGEQSEWDIYNNITQKIDAPIYTIVGNHEYKTFSGYDNNLSVYLANVEMPNNEIWYSFDSPNEDFHFIVINSIYYYHYPSIQNLSIEQNNWLMNDLKNNDINTTIVLFHTPMWTLLDFRLEESERIRNEWHDLFIQHDVDLVFHGHDHYYYRTQRDGITYITTGGGGAPLYEPTSYDTWLEGDITHSEYHFCKLFSDGRTLEIDIINSEENIIDSFNLELEKAPLAPNDVSTISGKEEVNITWSPPKDLGNANILNYKIFRKNPSNSDYIQIAETVHTTYIDRNLENGKEYYYKIKAENKYGASSFSEIVSEIPSTIPEKPLNLNGKIEKFYVFLEWSLPDKNGGSDIMKYNIYRSIDDNSSFIKINESESLTFKDYNFKSGKIYYYKITAENIKGQGPYSEELIIKIEDKLIQGYIFLYLLSIGSLATIIIVKKKAIK